MNLKKLVIGITGPMASGKNEAARIFKSFGAYIIDADRIGHIILQNQKKQIISAFGHGVLSRSGSVSRKKLARVVFSDKKKLNKLNLIMHPKILATIKSKISSSQAKINVINAAVLKEIGINKIVDLIVAVSAKKELRIKRIMKKGFSREDACLRINSQMTDNEYRKMADEVIYNNESIGGLKNKIISLYNKIKNN